MAINNDKTECIYNDSFTGQPLSFLANRKLKSNTVFQTESTCVLLGNTDRNQLFLVIELENTVPKNKNKFLIKELEMIV